MATPAETLRRELLSGEGSRELAGQWRKLTRAATLVAVFTSPLPFFWFYEVVDKTQGSIVWSALLTFVCVIAFRGLVDVGVRRFIPWPSLFGTDETRLKEEDVVNRRRAWYWRKKYRLVTFIALFVTGVWLIRVGKGTDTTWWGTALDMWNGFWGMLGNPAVWVYAVIFPVLFLFNFLILFGPLALIGITQMQAFEPGDQDWGVRLDDVRGQAEAKEEVRRVVNLWQSGEAFEKAGGKRERGLLMLGAPGTGKTMLSKAIATGFNCPFVSMPGSGFAQTFIGMDAVIVRYLVWKAKRLARKWGGQCIVFIDEIDAVGMRRQSLGPAGVGGFTGADPGSFHDFCFFGRNGALTATGDLVLETRAWRERLFLERAPQRSSPYGPVTQRISGIVNQMFPGMMGGMGQLALNQLLVVMDGIGNPRFTRKVLTNRINTFLDACYVIPRRIRSRSMRLPAPRPADEQIYFIGACNVPIEMLDPALIRPGRMGRHVWFRTPTVKDRLDIFDLYIDKVAHEEDLDRPERRDEIARITNGYSPAMIEQVCSMALTHAHHEGRERFDWKDLVEAMTTIESGTAVNIEYVPDETRAVAIHEAGHAVAGHVYMKGSESVRLSIRRRGQSLGHHQAREKDERFSSWRSEEMGRLIWTLGAMAAERVFYGENSTGVGGDVQSGTARAAWMVGSCGMGPERIELEGKYSRRAYEDEKRDKIMKRFEQIGLQIMNRSGEGGPLHPDPIAGVLADQDKRRMVAQLLGQAYLSAHLLVEANRDGLERIANELVERKEMHGNEVLDLLDGVGLRQPEVDLTDDRVWPKI
jgi:cell division protease FtsH